MKLPNVKRNRINAGGIKLSQSKNLIDYPEYLDPSILVDSLFTMAGAATQETILISKCDSEYVNTFFHYLKDCQEISGENNLNPTFSMPDESRNKGINGRNVMYA